AIQYKEEPPVKAAEKQPMAKRSAAPPASTPAISQPATAHPLDTKPNFDTPTVKVEPEPMIISTTPQVQNTVSRSEGYRKSATTSNSNYTTTPSARAKADYSVRSTSAPTSRAATTTGNSNHRPAASSARARQQNIRFCVQLAASPKPLSTSTPKWRQVSYRIEVIQESSLFKYQARHFLNFQQAFAAKLQVQKQGFKDAFIVAYKNGEKIPVQAAREELGQ
ncbi:MAG: hypothetical protein KTR30_26275, partial [Saprospiraceae bacterium]|nr:hypothetical protein [Saprospiraceae bacterium]